MLISTICSRRVVTAAADDSLYTIAQKMRTEHVGDVVVVGGPTGSRKPVGVLTDRDIVVAGFAEAGDRVIDLVASDIMTPNPHLIWESDTLDIAIERMASCGVRRLPVIDSHGELVGVISYVDLVSRLAHHLTRIVDHSVVQHAAEENRRQ